MSMYEQFETDSDSETSGVWLDYGEFRVRIARAGGANKPFQKKLDRLTRPYRRAIATDTLDAEVAADLLRRAYASAVVMDWETKRDDEFKPGIEQKDSDELMPATRENILEALRALPDLFSDIQSQASSLALFRAALREEASGN